MQKRTIVIIIMISLIAVVISFLIGTSKAFYTKTNGNEIISGSITGTLTDFQIMNIYVDGNETNTMSTGNYVIDEENSYCYVSDPLAHDANVTLHTNDNGEHIIGGFTKGEKCSLAFLSTQYLYWNDSFNDNYYGIYGDSIYPNDTYVSSANIPLNTYIHGLVTNPVAKVHIRTAVIGNNYIQSVCLLINNKEACFKDSDGETYNEQLFLETFDDEIGNFVEYNLENNSLDGYWEQMFNEWTESYRSTAQVSISYANFYLSG